MEAHDGPPVVFFDGVCGLCNGTVDWLLARDRRARLRFAPLQGETARRLLGELPEDALEWTFLLRDGAGTHERSDAVLGALQHVGGPWSLIRVLRLVPRALRDAVYRFVARRRYRWFGRRDACRLPSTAERERFLP